MLGAIALHCVAVLWLAWMPELHPGEGGRRSAKTGAVPVRVRAVVEPQGLAAAEPPPALAEEPGQGADKAPLSGPVATSGIPGSVPESEEQALLERLAREAAEAAAAREAIGAISFDDYIPAARLSQRPLIQEQVQLPWPEGGGVPDGALYMGRFRLYIDEQGRVRRIMGETGNLLPPLVRLTQDTFSNARFAPGELAGRQVKSWIRIEVTFDARGIVSTRMLN